MTKITITICYFAHLRQAAGNIAEEGITLPAMATISDALAEATRRHPNLQPHLGSILLTQNHHMCFLHHRVSDGDRIDLLPPVSGG